MYPTFTGNARRPRQVNLSGRQNPGPFGKQAGSTNTPNALANAQQNRLARQQDRVRTQAASSVQRVWRGYLVRRDLKAQEREHWDVVHKHHHAGYDLQTTHAQLLRLLRFFDPLVSQDRERLELVSTSLRVLCDQDSSLLTSNQWLGAATKLQEICLAALHTTPVASRGLFLEILMFLAANNSDLIADKAESFYLALREQPDLSIVPLDLLCAPLEAHTSSVVFCYRSLASALLTLPDLSSRLGGEKAYHRFSSRINCKLLTSAVAGSLKSDNAVVGTSQQLSRHGTDHAKNSERRVWLLAHLICLNRRTPTSNVSSDLIAGHDYTFVIATLLSSVADDILIEPPVDGEPSSSKTSAIEESRVVDPFIADQISSLVNQESIADIMSGITAGSGQMASSQGAVLRSDAHSRVLAGFILTLLRLFPRRSDDIRMWLYLGPSVRSSSLTTRNENIIHFFWQGVQGTKIFKDIYNDPRAAIALLKAPQSVAPALMSSSRASGLPRDAIEDEWRVILLFIELYSFVLKVMDDEEFFTQASEDSFAPSQKTSRRNSLGLSEIRTLSTFLKHLGFTMYYNASDIIGSREEESSKDVSSIFKQPATDEVLRADVKDKNSRTTSIPGVSLDHIKGVVTGLLRAIYERDSRRSFLPPDHWLMTSIFDMTKFISLVVEEEERRNRVQEAEDEDDEEDEDPDEYDVSRSAGLVGTGHAQRLVKLDQMRRQQRKASRRRYLQAVAPRLEILQNMPFLIPFTTRVQIFRRFVHMDQIKRRGGTVDPELWRLSQQHGMDPLRQLSAERHHAKVRRGHEFEDAYDQYFELGQGLKEPINITFVDQFDQPEAGIDGGGVTKEFLTSVTNQAFGDSHGIKLFVENDKHLMYPNPTGVEEQKELLRESGFKAGSQMFKGQVQDLLQRYEFLGRIIGKCLYEGILVDIGFAGFFLLKWALTGSTGSASRESGYRANLNDLRDYDEGLYQGLIQLKNYPGDVEDFALNFTVTDTLSIPPNDPAGSARSKAITKELRSNGSQIPVTNANRLMYISDMARHRLTLQPFAETSAFLRGLGSMVPASWLSMFNQTELQTLVGGAPTQINIADLRANTIYGGLYVIGDDGQEHPSVEIFWNVMESLPDVDRRKVLKFVTSTPRAPLLGFGSLMPRFSIRDSGDNDRLPSTSTCVNLLKLPRYISIDSCRKKLLQAVNSGAGFDLS